MLAQVLAFAFVTAFIAVAIVGHVLLAIAVLRGRSSGPGATQTLSGGAGEAASAAPSPSDKLAA